MSKADIYQMFLDLGVAVDNVILYHLESYLFYFVRELKLKRMKILQEFKLTTPNINYHNMQIKNQ